MNKRAGQPASVLSENLSQAIQGSIHSLFCTLLSPQQDEGGQGVFLQPWHCHRGQPHTCSAGADSTAWEKLSDSLEKAHEGSVVWAKAH